MGSSGSMGRTKSRFFLAVSISASVILRIRLSMVSIVMSGPLVMVLEVGNNFQAGEEGFHYHILNRRHTKRRCESRLWNQNVGRTWWEVSASVLYSFLANLADQRLDRYHVDTRWRASPDRLSINFIAV